MTVQKRTVLLAGVAVAGLAGAGIALFWAKGFLTRESQVQEEAASDHQQVATDDHHGHGKGQKETQEVETRLDPFVVNLAEANGRRYLRTTLQLSLHRTHDKEQIEQATPRIRDAVLLLLSSKRAEELMTVEGKTRLREEIIKQINATIGKEAVAAVYFVDFLIQ
jgi:flagellar FliL protein